MFGIYEYRKYDLLKVQPDVPGMKSSQFSPGEHGMFRYFERHVAAFHGNERVFLPLPKLADTPFHIHEENYGVPDNQLF